MALLIYKQWHRNANLTGTPNSNAKHIKYIGERIHALKKNNPENGLFGKFGGKPFTDKHQGCGKICSFNIERR